MTFAAPSVDVMLGRYRRIIAYCDGKFRESPFDIYIYIYIYIYI